MNQALPLVAALLLAPFTTPNAASAQKPQSRPNIIFILADDLGIDGVSCYGADKRKTPNIDKLAASGTRFQTCYAAPLCGPSRCLLMTGRYAFRTGGISNQSWAGGGPGAKSMNENPMAKLLKQGGYATGMAGKWRQVGETPREWGFDEYITDPTANGWFWQTKHLKNGTEVTLPEGTYAGLGVGLAACASVCLRSPACTCVHDPFLAPEHGREPLGRPSVSYRFLRPRRRAPSGNRRTAHAGKRRRTLANGVARRPLQ